MPFAPCWRVVSCQWHHLELRFRRSAETAETVRRAGWRSPRVGSLRLLLCLLRLLIAIPAETAIGVAALVSA